MKVVVTAALTGAATTRKHCPHLPYTPVEIAEEARRAAEAGAAIVHVHAREDDGRPTFRPEVFQAIGREIRARSGILLNWSTGGIDFTIEERTAHVAAFPPDMAALNMGSMNYAIYSSRTKSFPFQAVFHNSFPEIIACLEALNAAGVRPELECFDVGHIGNAEPLVDMGLLRPKIQFSLILGVLGGIPARTGNLIAMRDNLPADSAWQVIGIGRDQWRLVAAALALGGNVRVGLEDNFYLASGEMARSNGDLVAQAVRMVRDVGLEPATPEEARAILALPPG